MDINELPADKVENFECVFAHYTWLHSDCEVLKSNANEYAKSLVNNNITSKKRLCKKIKQFGTCYLQQHLQFLEDDAESVLESLGLLKDTAGGSQGTGDQQDVMDSVIDQDVVEKEDMTSSGACATPPQGIVANAGPDNDMSSNNVVDLDDSPSTQQPTKKRKRITGPEIDPEHELEIKKKIKTQLLENGITLSELPFLEKNATFYKKFLMKYGWKKKKGTGLITSFLVPPDSSLKLTPGDSLIGYLKDCLLTPTEQSKQGGASQDQNINPPVVCSITEGVGDRLHEAQTDILDYFRDRSNGVCVEIEYAEVRKGLVLVGSLLVFRALKLLVESGLLKHRVHGRKTYYWLTAREP